MSDKSAIGWTDATWNPTIGCSRVSEGCRNCYAERIAGRFSGEGQRYEGFAKLVTKDPENKPYHGGTGAPRLGFRSRWTGKVELVPGRLDQPLRWKRPRRIFVDSMSDLFHESLPALDIRAVLEIMVSADWHTYQVLTKRPRIMKSLVKQWLAERNHGGEPPKHIWFGVSVEDQATADERIPALMETPAAVRFVSYEPALAPVSFVCWPELDWIIMGGESGPGARPMDISWARNTRLQCQYSGIKFFFKQWGGSNKKAAGRELDGRTWDEMPEVR